MSCSNGKTTSQTCVRECVCLSRSCGNEDWENAYDPAFVIVFLESKLSFALASTASDASQLPLVECPVKDSVDGNGRPHLDISGPERTGKEADVAFPWKGWNTLQKMRTTCPEFTVQTMLVLFLDSRGKDGRASSNFMNQGNSTNGR